MHKAQEATTGSGDWVERGKSAQVGRQQLHRRFGYGTTWPGQSRRHHSGVDLTSKASTNDRCSVFNSCWFDKEQFHQGSASAWGF